MKTFRQCPFLPISSALSCRPKTQILVFASALSCQFPVPVRELSNISSGGRRGGANSCPRRASCSGDGARCVEPARCVDAGLARLSCPVTGAQLFGPSLATLRDVIGGRACDPSRE